MLIWLPFRDVCSLNSDAPTILAHIEIIVKSRGVCYKRPSSNSIKIGGCLITRTLAAFTAEIRFARLTGLRFQIAVGQILDNHNVRDPLDREVLKHEIHDRLEGWRRKSWLPRTDNNIVAWARVVHEYSENLSDDIRMPRAIRSALDQYWIEPYSTEWTRCARMIGEILGPRGPRAKKKIQQERFQEEYQLPIFPSQLPPSSR
jgi:hypothetical protein